MKKKLKRVVYKGNLIIIKYFIRASSHLGSSSQYPKTLDLVGSYLEDDEDKNPYFRTWNRVFIKYCDGGGH